eukprot:COSAG01_NODE_2384_length_7788_cov_8.398751_14_plen_239_part_00
MRAHTALLASSPPPLPLSVVVCLLLGTGCAALQHERRQLQAAAQCECPAGAPAPICCMAYTAKCEACKACCTAPQWCAPRPNCDLCGGGGGDGGGGGSCTEPRLVPLANVTRAQLTLDLDIASIPAGSVERRSFSSAFARDVAAVLGISPQRVELRQIRAGSVVVTFDVLPDPSSGAPISISALRTAVVTRPAHTARAPHRACEARVPLRSRCPRRAPLSGGGLVERWGSEPAAGGLY